MSSLGVVVRGAILDREDSFDCSRVIGQAAEPEDALCRVGDNSPGQQQITGVPGSPDATESIVGRQLPPPEPTFGGVVREGATQSMPW